MQEKAQCRRKCACKTHTIEQPDLEMRARGQYIEYSVDILRLSFAKKSDSGDQSPTTYNKPDATGVPLIFATGRPAKVVLLANLRSTEFQARLSIVVRANLLENKEI